MRGAQRRGNLKSKIEVSFDSEVYEFLKKGEKGDFSTLGANIEKRPKRSPLTKMTIAIDKKYYTPEEYLELEEKSEEKHEYRDGEIIVMAGGTTNHNILAGKFYARILLALEEQDYQIYMGDVRLWIPRYRLYTYPDVMVVKGKPVYHPPGITTITNSSLIVEVLSNSTKSYDQHDKFRYYRSIPQFKEYILIDQSSFFVEQFVKTKEGQWMFNEYETEEGILKLESVEFEISLKDLYRRVDFNLNED